MKRASKKSTSGKKNKRQGSLRSVKTINQSETKRTRKLGKQQEDKSKENESGRLDKAIAVSYMTEDIGRRIGIARVFTDKKGTAKVLWVRYSSDPIAAEVLPLEELDAMRSIIITKAHDPNDTFNRVLTLLKKQLKELGGKKRTLKALVTEDLELVRKVARYKKTRKKFNNKK